MPSERRERRRRILSLALPIIGAMVSQNVLNLVDTAMVGELGNEAIAAVGLGSFLNFLLTAFILGIGSGVQAMASRRVGEGRVAESAHPLNGGLLLATCIGVPWAILLIATAPTYVTWLNDDPAVVAAAVPYLQARLVAMPAMGMNFSFRGYWNAVDRSGLYMRTLFVMHGVNIFLNWVLIFGKLGAPELGPMGAGVANAIATYVGICVYFFLGFRNARDAGFLRRLPGRETMITMLRLAVPTGIQQTFFAGGMVVFFTFVGSVGTDELAATQVLVNLVLVGLLPGLGFGLAAMSLVGQALGRKDVEDARRWGWDVVRIGAVVVGCIAAPAVIAPELFLWPFLHDAATRDLAVWPLRLVALTLAGDAVGMILMNGMIGAGDTLRTMTVSLILQWLLFLPLAYLAGPVLGLGLTAIWTANVFYRQVQSGVFVWLWRRGHWATIKV